MIVRRHIEFCHEDRMVAINSTGKFVAEAASEGRAAPLQLFDIG